METTDSYDYHHSFLLAHVIRAEPLRCWRNAVLAVGLFPQLFAGGAYVEGWVVVPKDHFVEIVEHGWARTAEPRILDPTMVLREPPTQPLSYYPGLEVATQHLVQRTQGQVLPLVCHTTFGPAGMGHPGYKRAYDLAWLQAQTWARKKKLPETAIQVSGRESNHRGITLLLLEERDQGEW